MAAIIEAAGRVLPEHPRASMQQIAESAGLHRATVHRHFASRDDLVAAVRTQALEAAQEAADGVMARAQALPPSRALEQFVDAMLRVGVRYQLYRYASWQAEAGEAVLPIQEASRTLVTRAQESGALRRDLGVEHLSLAIGGLIQAAIPEICEGRMAKAEGVNFVLRPLANPR